MSDTRASKVGRRWGAIRLPPSYKGRILTGRVDGVAYLLGWPATFAHLTLWAVVLVLGPWDPTGIGRLVWLPMRLPEAVHALVNG